MTNIASAQYSTAAQRIVTDGLTRCNKAKSNETRDTFLRQAFDAVLQHPETTAREKAIATLGLHNAVALNKDDSVRFETAAAHAIASAVGGSIGCAVSSVVLTAWKPTHWYNEAYTKRTRWTFDVSISGLALKSIVDNAEPGSAPHTLAAKTLKETEPSSISNEDRANLHYEALQQMSKEGKRNWFGGGAARTEERAQPEATTFVEPSQFNAAELESLTSRLPAPLQTKVREITSQASTLMGPDSVLPAASKDRYHVAQIRGDFMGTAIKGYLDATKGSPDAESKQHVEHDFNLQMTMMKERLDALEKRFRQEAVEKVSEHTRLLAESFGREI